MLDAVFDAWVRLRGFGPDTDRSLAVDTRTKVYVALWERNHWLVESSVLMGMHPDFNSTRSATDVSNLFALWSEYSTARKHREDLLRLSINSLNRVLHEAVVTRMPDGPAPALDPELYFEPSVPNYPLVSRAWVPSTPDWFAEIGGLDSAEPWRVWWITRPAEHPYNTCFRPHHPEFPVFMPAGGAGSEVDSRIVADVDLSEPDPTAVNPSAPIPENRRETQISFLDLSTFRFALRRGECSGH